MNINHPAPRIFLVLTVLLFSPPPTTLGEDKPATAAELFGYTKLWDVEFRISEKDYRDLAPSQGRGFDRDFTYVEGEVTIAGHGPLKVGLRYKGNSSYSSASNTKKKSFKIDFNRVVSRQEFLGMSKLNLNNNILDPSQARETLAYQMFRDMGLPSCRTAFARVYLRLGDASEKEYLGLYTMVEQVSGAFLKDRFGTGKGLLLKPERNNSFPHFGEEWADYARAYVPKTEAALEFKKRLIDFTRFVEKSDEREFEENIASYVDLPSLLKFTALHAVLAHLDSFLLRGHNFYIYLPRGDGQFHWLPWDVNSAFAGHRSAGSATQQTNLSIDHPYTESVRLLSRIMKIASIRDEYKKQLGAVLAGPFKVERLRSRLKEIHQAISAAVAQDPNTDLVRFNENYIFHPREGDSRRQESPGGERANDRGRMLQKPPLGAFIRERIAAVLSQLSTGAEGYVPQTTTRRSRGQRRERPGENNRRPSRSPFPPRPGSGN